MAASRSETSEVGTSVTSRSSLVDKENQLNNDVKNDVENGAKLERQPPTIDMRSTRLPKNISLSHGLDEKHHQRPAAPIKVWMAYFNLIRAGMGAGMLGFPLAISQAGYILGPVLAMLTGFLLIHTQTNLLKTLYRIRAHLCIAEIPYRYGFRLAVLHGPMICHCIGHKGPVLVATFIILSQLGICTVFVILTTDSLRDMMDWDNNLPAILMLLPVYLLLQHFMRTLNIISYISLISTLFNALGQSLVFYLIFLNPHGNEEGDIKYATTEALPLLFAFGTYTFNLSGLGVIMTLDRNLENPLVLTKRFGIIQIGVLFPTVLAIVFGVLGYWSFGTMEENILRALPYDNIITMVCMGFYLIALILTYPIQCYPAIWLVTDVLKNLDKDGTYDVQTLRILEAIARPLFVLITFGICYSVPFQACFVAFAGNLCTSMISLVFPAIMEIGMMFPGAYGKYNIYLIKNLLIIFLGLVCFVFGTYICGYLIYIRILIMRSPHSESESEN